MWGHQSKAGSADFVAMYLLLHQTSDNPSGHTIMCDSKDQTTWGGTSPLSLWKEAEQEALRGQHNWGVAGPGGPGDAAAEDGVWARV